ncbi:MAG: TonB-dependent receptor [Polyangiales bacterium]
MLTVSLTWLAAASAHAQRTGENVVTAAKDAFGISIGNEEIGLYSASEVRGFSPLDAGNVRIEGFWFDPQASLGSRLVERSTVHVGLTAQGYPFPAPTGIVDYQLRRAGDDRVVSVLTGLGEYAGPFAEVDAKIPLVKEHLSLAAGLSYSFDEYYDGSDAHVASLALIPRWRPRAELEITPFFSFTLSRDEEVAPYIVTSGPHLPPYFPRRRYYGQPWADLATHVSHLGVLARTSLGAHGELSVALFHSRRTVLEDHAELFVDTTRAGATRERVIADPPQHRAANGGELSLVWAAGDGPLLHQLRARVLGRVRDSRISGASAPLELGERQLGAPNAVPQPDFQFNERTHDLVQQVTGGLAYAARWREVGELELGVQKTTYHKAVDLPALPVAETQASPWLVNAALALHATGQLALYAGYTRGLEESGIAPGQAANRNAALPAIITQQLDAGVRYGFTDDIRLVAGVFDVRKPYFTTDEQNVFGELGEVRHQGVELSFTGQLFERLTWVAGAVLMRPRVTGPAVDAGRIQPRPVGQTSRTVRGNLNFRLPLIDGASLDLGFVHVGERSASSDYVLAAPAMTTLDLGARYRFNMFGRPSTLRAQMLNVTNTRGWRVLGSHTFRASSPRSLSVTLALDL